MSKALDKALVAVSVYMQRPRTKDHEHDKEAVEGRGALHASHRQLEEWESESRHSSSEQCARRFFRERIKRPLISCG
eukprot:4881878-Pleurochrysis_carterae.AAC.1